MTLSHEKKQGFPCLLNPHRCREIKQILRKKEEDELQKFASKFFIC